MKFYWPEGPTAVLMKMGDQVRGMQQKGLRPESVTFEPEELIRFLSVYGPDKMSTYLNICQMALRVEPIHCEHGKTMTEYCLPCNRIHGGG